MRWDSALRWLALRHTKEQSFAIKPTPFGKDIVIHNRKYQSAGVSVTWCESPEPRPSSEGPFGAENSFPTTKSVATISTSAGVPFDFCFSLPV